MTAAVITGLGVATPAGLGVGEYWSSTLAGRNAITRITRFDPSSYPSQLAGQIDGFDAAEHLPSRLLAQTDRMTKIALAAADWAFEDAGIDPQELADYTAGAVTASHAGGFEFGQNELKALWSRGAEYVSAYQSFAWFYAVNSGQISIRNRLRGPSSVVVSDQAGGLDALAQARRAIRDGTSVMIAGGVDASICPWGWVSQLAGGKMTTQNDPALAFLPFDARAHGYVAGEGGALLVVEDLRHARARGARQIYGEILGHAATIDPEPGTGGDPGLRRAIELALRDAGLGAGDVDVVFADAAGDPESDRIEADALVAVFGAYGVPVTAPKTMTGRLYSGAATVDIVAALLSIRDGVIPPTIGTTRSDSYLIDLVGARRTTGVRTALIIARGSGGFNAAMVVGACRATAEQQ